MDQRENGHSVNIVRILLKRSRYPAFFRLRFIRKTVLQINGPRDQIATSGPGTRNAIYGSNPRLAFSPIGAVIGLSRPRCVPTPSGDGIKNRSQSRDVA